MAERRVSFRWHALVYLAVNAFLVVLWWTGRTPGGAPDSFWPFWSIVGWGIGLGFHAFHAFGGSEDAVAREERKLRERYGRS